MSELAHELPQHQAAFVAGIGLLFMFISGIFGTRVNYEVIFENVFYGKGAE